MTNELWPEGAFVRRYYEPRKAMLVGSNANLVIGERNVPNGINATH